MSFLILRTQKIKTRNEFTSSVRHHYRLGGLENCDSSKTDLNLNFFESNECLERFSKTFNKGGRFEKRRKDAVLAIEYLVTASPDFFKNKSDEEVKEFLRSASDYLRAKHGNENVILETWEFDETTPHLSMVVIPVDDKGKLNCKHFLGGAQKLRALQDDFHLKVGLKFGLERGKPKEQTRASYQDLKTYYSELRELKKRIEEDEFEISNLDDDEKIRLIYDLVEDRNSFKNEIDNLKNQVDNLEYERDFLKSSIDGLYQGRYDLDGLKKYRGNGLKQIGIDFSFDVKFNGGIGKSISV